MQRFDSGCAGRGYSTDEPISGSRVLFTCPFACLALMFTRAGGCPQPFWLKVAPPSRPLPASRHAPAPRFALDGGWAGHAAHLASRFPDALIPWSRNSTMSPFRMLILILKNRRLRAQTAQPSAPPWNDSASATMKNIPLSRCSSGSGPRTWSPPQYAPDYSTQMVPPQYASDYSVQMVPPQHASDYSAQMVPPHYASDYSARSSRKRASRGTLLTAKACGDSFGGLRTSRGVALDAACRARPSQAGRPSSSGGGCRMSMDPSRGPMLRKTRMNGEHWRLCVHRALRITVTSVVPAGRCMAGPTP